MPLDLLVGQFADSRPTWRHRSKPGGRRSASTPSPPISAAPPRRMRQRGGCKRCLESGRSQPVFSRPRFPMYPPSARPLPVVARTVYGWLPRDKGFGDFRQLVGCGHVFGVSSAVLPARPDERPREALGPCQWRALLALRFEQGVLGDISVICHHLTVPSPFRSGHARPGIHRRHAAREAPPVLGIGHV
jgi:hypothetical protein